MITKLPLAAILAFLIIFPARGAAGGMEATATLSRRWAKPGQPVELLVTIRNASNDVTVQLACPAGVVVKPFRSNQRIPLPDGERRLYRYRLLIKNPGDYEFPPLRVSDGRGSVQTQPLSLRVGEMDKPHPLSVRELSSGTAIPESLAREVVTSLPFPPPKSTPTPAPKDSTPVLVKALKWFWSYPGK